MDDDGGSMDICEYVGNEMVMRRLLRLLRQTQSYCTDTECFQDVIASGNSNQDSNFVLFGLFIAFATMLYFLRPRNTLERVGKLGPLNNDRDDSPPPNPPPPAL